MAKWSSTCHNTILTHTTNCSPKSPYMCTYALIACRNIYGFQHAIRTYVQKTKMPLLKKSLVGTYQNGHWHAVIPFLLAPQTVILIIWPNVDFLINLLLRIYCMLDLIWGTCKKTLNSRSCHSRINHSLKVIGYVSTIPSFTLIIKYQEKYRGISVLNKQ